MRLLEVLLKFFSIERAKVQGASMEPTLCDGQVIWVKMLRASISRDDLERIRGRVVLIERDEMPGILLIKRLEKVHGELIWIEGDNKEEKLAQLQNDSTKFDWLGKHTIKGKALRRFPHH